MSSIRLTVKAGPGVFESTGNTETRNFCEKILIQNV